MDAVQVLPPLYEKRVGRPPKARKKQAHEVQGSNGPRLTRHGVTMHCKHCKGAGHNSAGCSLKKMGFSEEEAKALVARTQATLQREAEEQAKRAAADQVPTDQLPSQQVNENETPDPLNISSTQPPSVVDMTQASTTMLSQMLGEETEESLLSQPQGPLPDPTFILSNQLVQRPTPLNTSTLAGKAALAKKRKASTKQNPSSKKTKTSTSRSAKRTSKVQEQGHADSV
ncbi:unnamed protein product [Urochloa decumbens]|uniref:Uncharacterized protein n=1 Tax=Urochloa decumbens TaxID=240449 RepID=A0ABC9F9I7_9POAL